MGRINKPGDQALATLLAGLERRLHALEVQQQFVVSDPRATGNEGDPTRGNAIAVVGSLQLVGIPSWGIATYHGGIWKQL